MINSLTTLRGIFILFIFFHHVGIYPGGGSMATTFFFVLSGFSLTLGYKDKVMNKEFSYLSYLKRRFIKFYPLHWITLIINIPLLFLSSLDYWLIPVFFINAALLHSLIPIKEVYFSFNAVSWFLSDILLFALLFPFVLKYIVNMNSTNRLKLSLIIMTIYMGIIFIVPSSLHHAIFYISPFVRITDFILGIILSLFFLDNIIKKDIPLSHHFYFIILVLCIILLIIESCLLGPKLELFAPLYWPIIAAIIILAAKSGEPHFVGSLYFDKLGEVSFTFFLVHRLVIQYTNSFLSFNNKIIYILFCLVISIVISIMLEQYLLKPISQWLTKRFQPSMTARS